MPIMEPTICCSDNRGCVQVVEDPGRHRVNTTHVDASAFKVREYVQRRRVTVRWIPTGECLGDIFTKNTIEAEQFFRLWHTLCGYKSWSVLEEITTKAAAIAIVVEGRYLTVTDMRACNAYASACHAQLRLIGDPHGGYYDEGRVWHPHVKAPAQATYGLGVGATTVVGPGGSRSRWASGSAPGAVSPGQAGSTDPRARAGGSSRVQ